MRVYGSFLVIATVVAARSDPSEQEPVSRCVCVYYCRTYFKAARGGEGDSGGHVLLVHDYLSRSYKAVRRVGCVTVPVARGILIVPQYR